MAGFHMNIVTYTEKKSSINLRVLEKMVRILEGSGFAGAFLLSGSAFPRLPRRLRLLAMTNLEALRGRRWCKPTCDCQRRSLSAATDAIGAHHFNDSLYQLAAFRREGHVPPGGNFQLSIFSFPLTCPKNPLRVFRRGSLFIGAWRGRRPYPAGGSNRR